MEYSLAERVLHIRWKGNESYFGAGDSGEKAVELTPEEYSSIVSVIQKHNAGSIDGQVSSTDPPLPEVNYNEFIIQINNDKPNSFGCADVMSEKTRATGRACMQFADALLDWIGVIEKDHISTLVNRDAANSRPTKQD